jgi:2-oxoglutarate ferredoxin oxidoreductase subunit alpha
MSAGVKGYVTVEMSLSSQMAEDVLLACKHDRPVYSYLTSLYIPTSEGIIAFCRDVLAGKIEQTEAF